MAKTTKLKRFGVGRVTAIVDRDGSQYSHARILFYGQGEHASKIAEVTFQAHRAEEGGTNSYGCVSYDFEPGHEPSAQFDYGHVPYTGFYAGRIQGARDGLDCEHVQNAEHEAKRLLGILKTVKADQKERNLGLKFPGCQLSAWLDSLEYLGVPIELKRLLGGKEYNGYPYRDELTSPYRKALWVYQEAKAPKVTSVGGDT